VVAADPVEEVVDDVDFDEAAVDEGGVEVV